MPMCYTEFAEPSFNSRISRELTIDDQAFEAWIAADSIDASIDRALAAGKVEAKAAIDMPEQDDPRGTLVAIDLSHGRNKPLVQALARRGVGRTDILHWTYEIGIRHVMGPRFRPASDAQVNATLDAFALVLSRQGFKVQVLTG